MSKPSDLIHGTLDLLILNTISLEPQHGWAIAKRIQQVSREVLQVSQGALYPALHRLEQQGWIRAEWRVTEGGRDAKFYTLTKAGRAQLANRAGAMGADVERRRAGDSHGAGGIRMRLRRWYDIARLRLRSVLGRGGVERELDKELWFHFDQQVRENVGKGMSPEDARAAAARSFGGLVQIQEECRDMRRTQSTGNHLERPAVCGARAGPHARLYGDHRADAGAGDWREQRDFQRDSGGAAAAAAVRAAGPDRAHFFQ